MIENLTTRLACECTSEDVCYRLKTDPIVGLDGQEVEHRLKLYGYNELPMQKGQSILAKYFEQFKNPLIILLLVAAGISLLLREFDDAFSITFAIFIVSTVAFVQEYRSEKEVEALNKLIPPSCHCLRNGNLETFDARHLVPGDIVLLKTGDRISADMRLIECNNLALDESSFTGENEPVLKSFEPIIFHSNLSNVSGGGVQMGVAEKRNIAFMGTFVRAGNGKGVVINTGRRSEFGELFNLMQAQEAPRSPLQLAMDKLGQQLALFSGAVIVFISFIGLLQKRDLMELFTVSVSLAVAAIPEGLPIAVTVALALGVRRMARKNAIIKRLPTVETLGCTKVICSDKTGTLTQNNMTVVKMLTSELYYIDVHDRLGPKGVGFLTLAPNQPEQNYNLLAMTPSETQMNSIRRLVEVGCLCNNAVTQFGQIIGQPTEAAILMLANKIGLDDARERFERKHEVPFGSEHKYMAVCCQSRNDINIKEQTFEDHHYQPLFFVKGAVEQVLNLCTSYMQDKQLLELGDIQRKEYFEKARQLGSEGLRVLVLAYGSNMNNLSLVGMMGMIDPPRPGVEDAITSLKTSNVDIKMLTGDSKETACAVAQRLGLYQEGQVTLSGEEVERMSYDCSYNTIIDQAVVFYRVSPSHKLYIVRALQAMKKVVAMTGDGVNDAVALKKADIGIAMGQAGTDVCKEAADMILADDDFYTIMLAIEEGKGIYYNIQNFLRFQLSTSFAALMLISLTILTNISSPLNSMQILWVNVIMDGPPAQSLSVEPVDADIISKPPRDPKEPMITKELIIDALMIATIITLGTLFVFFNELNDGKVTPRDTTMSFTTFVFFAMFNALGCRSKTKSVFELGLATNQAFLLAVAGSLAGQMLVIYMPLFQSIFKTEALSFADLLNTTFITSSVLFVSEAMKFYKHRQSRRGMARYQRTRNSSFSPSFFSSTSKDETHMV